MRRIVFLALAPLMLMALFVATVSTQAQIDVLRFKVVKSIDAQLQAMLEDDVDVLTQRTRPWDIDILDAEGYTILNRTGFHISFIGFNIRPDQSYRRPEITFWPLADENFRHALAHSLDRDTIVTALGGYIKDPVESLVPPGFVGWYNPYIVWLHPFNPGDPFATTLYDPLTGENEDTCSILRYAGYTFADAGTIGVVDAADYWNMPNAGPLPDMEVLSPTYVVDPQKAEVVRWWIGDLGEIGLQATLANGMSGFEHVQDEFWPYATQVYENADFDAYIMNFKLNRFPDYLYDWFHSSQDSLLYPSAYNAFGVDDPELDVLLETVKFSLDHAAKVEACYAAQDRLADGNQEGGLPVLPVYTITYFDAFNADLRGIVPSTGFGAGDGGCVALREPNGPSPSVWTYLNIHWEPGTERIDPGTGGTLINWCLSEEPERLNPLYAGTTLGWEIMDRVFDPLVAVNPYTLEDIPWIAADWDVVETGMGMDVTYYLRDDVFWQDGYQYTAWDAEFSLEFIRDWQISKYRPAWQNIVDVEVNSDFTFTVHADMTSQFLIYDWAVLAALLPPQVWDRSWADLQTVVEYDPTEPYNVAPGYSPGPWADQVPTNLFGTGPFIFQFYDPLGMYSDLWANENYFWTTTEIDALKVQMFHEVGDVDENGYISALDASSLGLAYGYIMGEPDYNPDTDLDGDGETGILDAIALSTHFGLYKEYPPSGGSSSPSGGCSSSSLECVGRESLHLLAAEESSTSETTLYVHPEHVINETLQPGMSFTVDIYIANVTDLMGFDFRLMFNSSILNATSITPSVDFFITPYVWKSQVNNTSGFVQIAVTEDLGITQGVSGNGKLATIELLAVGYGDSTLDLVLFGSSKLGNSKAISVDHVAINGYFSNRMPGDCDGDRDCDYDDLVILAGAYGSSGGQPAYDGRADFDHDGDVDYDDLILLAGNYGTSI